METTFIYGLFDPRTNKLKYIGKSDNPEQRLQGHISESIKRIGHNYKKEKWIRHLLSVNLMPVLRIIAICGVSNWQEFEKSCISQAKIKGFNLTNIADGGEGGAIKFGPHSPETIAKIKLSKQVISKETREKLSISIKKNWETARKFSDGAHNSIETRNKISATLKGIKKSDNTIKNMKLSQQNRRAKEIELGIIRISPTRGKPKTEEQKRKISEKLKGHRPTEETREKISKALKGRIITDEMKKKISKKLKGRVSPGKGRVWSEETLKKRSDSMKKYWERKKSRNNV